MKKLSIVIPVFNEGSLIIELIKRVKINAEQITQDYEIVLVDDGSNDTTWQMISDESCCYSLKIYEDLFLLYGFSIFFFPS